MRKGLIDFGRVRQPSEIRASKDILRGPGAKKLDEFDRFVLLQLMLEEPSRSLSNYVHFLHEYTGTVVSESTVSRFFLKAFSHRGRFVKPNLVPYDKFRPENESRAYEFLYLLSHFSPWRVKFGDEKLLKGQEVYNRKVRRDPRTGKIPVMTATPDFRNTHAITGFCGIDESTNPV